MTILCRDLSNIATDTVKNIDYGCIIHDFNKSETINLSESYGIEDCGYIYVYIYIYKMHIKVHNFDFDN